MNPTLLTFSVTSNKSHLSKVHSFSEASCNFYLFSFQACECEDICIGASCKCTQLSLQSWYDSEGKLLPEFNFFGKLPPTYISYLMWFPFKVTCIIMKKLLLYIDPPMLFECNEMCSCNVKLCRNRVVQRGFKVRFQLFRTVGKGWGVRTLTLVPKGTYVCE